MLNSFSRNILSVRNNVEILDAVVDSYGVYRSESTNLNVLFNDAVAGTITVTVTSGPTNGTAIVQGNNTITYTNNGNVSASDSFTYSIDNGISQDSAVVTLTISDAPTPGGDAVAFNISSASAATFQSGGSLACGLTINSIKYYEGLESFPTLANTIYNEAAKTTTFNGGDNYYAIDGGKTIRINASGVVLDVWVCSGGGGNQ